MNYYLIKGGGEIIIELDKIDGWYLTKEGERLINYLERVKLELLDDCCVVNDIGLAAERGEK